MPPTCAQGRAAKAAMENFSSSLCHGLPVLFFACGGKESACNPGEAGDIGSIPGWGRSPGGGLGNPLQYSCLENPVDRAAWWAAAHGVTKSQTRLKQLNTSTYLVTRQLINSSNASQLSSSTNDSESGCTWGSWPDKDSDSIGLGWGLRFCSSMSF